LGCLPVDEPLAIVAGDGALPRLLARDCARRQRRFAVVLFGRFRPDWVAPYPVIEAEFEKPGRLFKALGHGGFRHVTFAGSMQRPRLRLLRSDMKFLRLAPGILNAMKAGDDTTLRTVISIFEAEGLTVVGGQDVLENLLVPAGVQTVAKVSGDDWADIRRACAIARALGKMDVGQGAVVAQGVCLGVESIQGTDAMLDWAAHTGGPFRVNPKGAKGVLVKVPKPDQDRRVDMPAVGPETMAGAHTAGLAGVAVQAGGVLVLGLQETISKANELGLFFLGFTPDEAE